MPARPDPAPWPMTDRLSEALSHGTPLTINGNLMTALRDASWYNRPDTTKFKVSHVAVWSKRLRLTGGVMGGVAAACDPARIMLDDEGTIRDAVKVGHGGRCTRPGCAALYAIADEQARLKRTDDCTAHALIGDSRYPCQSHEGGAHDFAMHWPACPGPWCKLPPDHRSLHAIPSGEVKVVTSGA